MKRSFLKFIFRNRERNIYKRTMAIFCLKKLKKEFTRKKIKQKYFDFNF